MPVMTSAQMPDILMPLDIVRQRELEARWERVRAALEQSVQEIVTRTSPAEQPDYLARAVAQFRRHVDALSEDLPQLAPVVDELGKVRKGGLCLKSLN